MNIKIKNLKQELKNSISYLSFVCDGAESLDGKGFNQYDAQSLKHIDIKELPDYRIRQIAPRVYKYRRQLEKADIDITCLKKQALKQKEEEKTYNGIVKYNNSNFIFDFDYNKELISEIKALNGRWYNPENKIWTVKSKNKDKVKKIIKKYNLKKDFDFSNIKIKKQKRKITAKDGHYILNFEYNREIIKSIKNLFPVYDWNPKEKQWEIPDVYVKQLKKFIDKYDFEFSDDVEELMKKALIFLENSQRKYAEIKTTFQGNKLYPFQAAGVKYMIDKKKALVADEMGLGKTIETIAALELEEAYPVIIIVPAVVKYNWKKEFEKWTDKKVCILTEKFNEEADVFITNYAQLKKFTNYPGLGELQIKKDIRDIVKSVVVDESHKVKNHKAQRTKLVKYIAKDKEYKYLLTGTPILNNPSDLIQQLDILDCLSDFGGFWKFTRRYCNGHQGRWGYECSGASNLEELDKLLRQICMVRREKSEVFEELPDKVRQNIDVNISNRRKYKKAENNLAQYMREEENKTDDEIRSTTTAEILAKITKLRKVSAIGKIKKATNFIKDIIENDEKVVVFAHHKEVINSLQGNFDALKIDGSVSQKERQNVVDKFQNDPKEKVIVCSILAAGVGITLHAASKAVMVESGWTFADNKQAEDRIHRIGQEDKVNIYYLLAHNTIDDYIHSLVMKKKDISEKATKKLIIEELKKGE